MQELQELQALTRFARRLRSFLSSFGGRAQLRFQFRAAPLDLTEFLMK